MPLKICVAGVSGWTGSLVAKHILDTPDLTLAAAVARTVAGKDVGDVLGRPAAGLRISPALAEALKTPFDVLVD